MHRVVILGGGFGGLYAAQALRHAPVDVTLIDRRNFHLFQPLLYQVATGSLSPGEIAEPLRAVLRNQKNARVLLGDAVDLDAVNRRLILADGEVPYDSLIVATGAQNYFFGHPEWQKIAPGLKSIEDATAIRHNILYAFEEAERHPDPAQRRAWLTFVIVGAGPTGVELAGALAEIAHDTLRHDFRTIHPEESKILLLDGTPHVLAAYPVSLSIDAEHSLIKLGVLPRTGVRVTCIDADGVTLETPSGPDRIEAKTVLWAAGVAPSDFGKILAKRAEAPLDKQGHVMVDPNLNIPGHPEIFVIGDLAVLEQDGKPLPGVAPVAMQQGKYAARKLLNKTTKPFHYFNKGSLAVIGRRAGVADFGFLRFHGAIAWLLWLFVHLMYLVQFRNRVIVFIRWGFQYLTFDRGARLITMKEDKT
ncbi:MAG TPA: NAD(P)/FAD-dependent oxidoreductase [Bryobacteraceae bacterium]|jgi:NADH dehydrogenase|nr:NAD(P)/FAD-dependent oxidoreductase [Bryobacteraceae bacterium]